MSITFTMIILYYFHVPNISVKTVAIAGAADVVGHFLKYWIGWGGEK